MSRTELSVVWRVRPVRKSVLVGIVHYKMAFCLGTERGGDNIRNTAGVKAGLVDGIGWVHHLA